MLTFLQWMTVSEGVGTISKVIPRDHVIASRSHLAAVMPKGKVKHSLRVGSTLAKIGAHPSTVKAALFHDYSERGGKLSKVPHLDDHERSIVDALTDKEKDANSKNGPLEHVKRILSHPSMTPKLKNEVILLKATDRLDNLKRRRDHGGVGKTYAKKSHDLIKYMFQHYSGKPEAIHAIRKKLTDVGVHVSKQHIGTATHKTV